MRRRLPDPRWPTSHRTGKSDVLTAADELSPDQWAEAKEEIRSVLINTARPRDVISYRALVSLLSSARLEPNGRALADLLREISLAEDSLGRGMLTAVAVREDKRMPGNGFFDLAGQLGRDTSDKVGCWSEEIKRVYEAWAVGPVSEEVLEVTRRIVNALDPLRVILFGSEARGGTHRWSDIDLLVVVPDERDERQASDVARQATRGVKRRCDVFVAKAGRIRRSGRVVGTILRPALTEGKLLYDARAAPRWDVTRPASMLEVEAVTEQERQATTREWLERARQELRAAEGAARVSPSAFATLCYLAQQVTEKALKAVLVFEQIEYPFSHDLDDVRNLIPCGWRVKEQYPDLKWLSDWAIEGRYPGRDPTAGEAQRALEHARSILESVEQDLRSHGFAEE